MIHLRPAAGVIRWFLKRYGYAAIATPWRVVYALPGHESARLLRHEAMHFEQMERDGLLAVTVFAGFSLADVAPSGARPGNLP